MTEYSYLLSLIFVLYMPFEIWSLRRAAIKVTDHLQIYTKAGLAVALSVIELIFLLASTAVSNRYRDRIPALTAFLAAIELCIILSFGHRRTVRPSTPVILYLSSSLIKDLVALTLPSGNREPSGLSLLVARAALELSLLVTESQSKSRVLKPQYSYLTPEERTGILGRVFFWWINPVLKQGYRDVLTPNELPVIDEALSAKILRKRMIRAWGRRSKPEAKFTLPFALFKGFRREFLLPVLPRLFLIVFRYSQPILIGITIEYIQHTDSEGKSIDTGYWLVILTGIIYSGLAISTSCYQHKLNRLQLITRGALVEIIYARSLRVESSPVPNGRALTLMSADVDSVDTSAEMVHETWAQLVEVIVGTSLLARQIGWFALLPLVIIFVCSRMSAYVAKHLQGRQKDWSAATQHRLTTIASAFGGVKSMKILGLEEAVNFLISNLRDREIAMSKRLRWIMVAYNASANALGIFSPVLTLVLFAVSQKRGGSLDPDTVFTSIALLALVTHPANMVMTLIPRAVACLANFERIQMYLTEGLLLDKRAFIRSETTAGSKHSLETRQRLAILMENVQIQPSSTSPPILQGVNLEINRGSVVMFSGPVNSGKSALALTILGEIVPREGKVAIADEAIGFCNQLAWLPTASIRDAICQGDANLDENWYDTVIELCGLRKDLETFADRDMTWVGSGGINLSGGQKSRIALARAIYSRCSILILDDPFSALDGEVESHVVQGLLGPQGILRTTCTTVLLITNSAQYYALADKIVLLDDGRVQVLDPRHEIVLGKPQISKILMSGRKVENKDSANNSTALADRTRMEDAAADVARRTGDIALYGYYFGSVGASSILLMASCTAIYAFCLTFSQFGQDIQLVDKQLPPAFSNLSVQIFKLLVQTAILFAVQHFMALTLPFCAICVSKLYTNFIETVDGIATIRAFGWEHEFEHDNISRLDTSQNPLYLLLCLQRWLNVVLDLLITGIALLLIAFAVSLRDTATGAEIGVALNMIIAANTTLLRLMENWTSVETSLGAISRLRSIDYNTPSEDKSYDYLEPSSQWPIEGSIKIKDLSVGYAPQKLVLRDLNLEIQPGQTFVLCGRSGSGKSSLFLTLLRLLNPRAGSIEVEDVDIARLPVHMVRRRGFIAVPQDPFLLSGASLRFNLDPYNRHHDAAIVKVLKQTGLWPHIHSSSEFQERHAAVSTSTDAAHMHDYLDIIDKPLSTFSPVSAGQRQMFALAQALLRVQPRSSTAPTDDCGTYYDDRETKPIVILDEPSSSLDPETEAKMQELMKEHIIEKGHTVIMISHRDINAQKDVRQRFGTVIWMKNGKVLKFMASLKISPEQ
ncbi:hypothetical protein N8T08_001763 [Aspergillus melleus]|uniref:Uncharacterized protein n=1 Tax=Aspergillus melleus TaxID=138277 RepID=A0ACC3AMN2_9EURO|nr:hypothetical protein N8T08_001763 [Aspergillus melleus]